MNKQLLKRLTSQRIRITPPIYRKEPYEVIDNPWLVHRTERRGLWIELMGERYSFTRPFDNIREFMESVEHDIFGVLVLKVQLRIEGNSIKSTPILFPKPGSAQFIGPSGIPSNQRI